MNYFIQESDHAKCRYCGAKFMLQKFSMFNIRDHVLNKHAKEYDRIIRALAKIEDGSYGICIDCAKQIGEKRLANNPNSSRCLMCQEIFEEKAD